MAMGADFSEGFEQIARDEADRLRVRAIDRRARVERWMGRVREVTAEAERIEARRQHLTSSLAGHHSCGSTFKRACCRPAVARGGPADSP